MFFTEEEKIMVGNRLEELLNAKKIKPGTLATMTGISKSTIYSIIKRNNKNVAYSTMEKIADALGVPVEYFYDHDSAEEKEKPVPMNEDEQVKEIIELIAGLSDQKKAEALRYLRYLSASEESE
jgi:transcriptional regulator with XRE-family HTH domain